MADNFEFVIAIAILFSALNSNLIEGRSMLKSMHLSWGTQHSGFLQPIGRDDVMLVLDPVSGSGIQSKDEFLFGTVEMQIKLVPGDSAGTVTSFYEGSVDTNQAATALELVGFFQSSDLETLTYEITRWIAELTREIHKLRRAREEQEWLC